MNNKKVIDTNINTKKESFESEQMISNINIDNTEIDNNVIFSNNDENSQLEKANNLNKEKNDIKKTNIQNSFQTKKSSFKRTIIIKKKKCYFHKPELIQKINYLNIRLLKTFLNQKGFIKKRMFNNLCQKHQRYTRKMIIISRHLHLLPYISI